MKRLFKLNFGESRVTTLYDFPPSMNVKYCGGFLVNFHRHTFLVFNVVVWDRDENHRVLSDVLDNSRLHLIKVGVI